jgi:hypothetical protein
VYRQSTDVPLLGHTAWTATTLCNGAHMPVWPRPLGSTALVLLAVCTEGPLAHSNTSSMAFMPVLQLATSHVCHCLEAANDLLAAPHL